VSFLRHDQLPVYRCCAQHLFTFDATGRPKVPRLVFLRNLIALERNQSSRTAQSFLEGLQAEVCNAFALARIVYNTPAMLQLSSKTTRPAFAGRVLVRFLSL